MTWRQDGEKSASSQLGSLTVKSQDKESSFFEVKIKLMKKEKNQIKRRIKLMKKRKRILWKTKVTQFGPRIDMDIIWSTYLNEGRSVASPNPPGERRKIREILTTKEKIKLKHVHVKIKLNNAHQTMKNE